MKGTGALESPYDIRTFAYAPSGVPNTGGKKYQPKDIEDQHKVGICTSISLTQNARKALGTKFSADFQYLCQKKFKDGNWSEGSSISHALWVAKNIGLLPEKEWTYTTEADRKGNYQAYIKKLQAIPDTEIEKLKLKASKYKLKAYASVAVDRDLMADAIIESASGILTRYTIGNEWWKAPIEPLRPPKVVVSGHAVTDCNYSGTSFRIANTWGTDWADKGTAYRLHAKYKPTEAWIPYYQVAPEAIEKKLESRTKLQGQLLDLLQKLLTLLK